MKAIQATDAKRRTTALKTRIRTSSLRRRSAGGDAAARHSRGCAVLRPRRNKNSDAPDYDADFRIPEPLRVNENELCVALERAALAGGATGQAAKALMKILQPHLLKEEEDLLRTVGLLGPLARGQFNSRMSEIAAKTERLKSQMFQIMREHVAIAEAAQTLLHSARRERKLTLARFTERLMLRIWMDETVFYPAAILIGEYIKLKTGETGS